MVAEEEPVCFFVAALSLREMPSQGFNRPWVVSLVLLSMQLDEGYGTFPAWIIEGWRGQLVCLAFFLFWIFLFGVGSGTFLVAFVRRELTGTGPPFAIQSATDFPPRALNSLAPGWGRLGGIFQTPPRKGCPLKGTLPSSGEGIIKTPNPKRCRWAGSFLQPLATMRITRTSVLTTGRVLLFSPAECPLASLLSSFPWVGNQFFFPLESFYYGSSVQHAPILYTFFSFGHFLRSRHFTFRFVGNLFLLR